MKWLFCLLLWLISASVLDAKADPKHPGRTVQGWGLSWDPAVVLILSVVSRLQVASKFMPVSSLIIGE